jgi:hypothetical protein
VQCLHRVQTLRHGVIADDNVDTSVLEDMVDFVGFEEIVDRHHHSTGLQDPKKSGNELGTILQPQAHAVSELDAEFALQSRGQPASLHEQQFISELLIAPKNGGLSSVHLCCGSKGGGEIHRC